MNSERDIPGGATWSVMSSILVMKIRSSSSDEVRFLHSGPEEISHGWKAGGGFITVVDGKSKDGGLLELTEEGKAVGVKGPTTDVGYWGLRPELP